MPRVPKVEENLPIEFNIFRAMAHSEAVTKGFSSLGGRLLTQTKLDPKVREAVINAISFKLDAPYEWSHHAKMAMDVGATTEDLEAIRAKSFDKLAPSERAAVEYAYKVEDNSVTDGDVDALRNAGFDDEQIVELTVLAGFYGMTARFLNAMGVQVDDGNPDRFGLPEGA
jgi:4-carboxymuconolactone decarboxylase